MTSSRARKIQRRNADGNSLLERIFSARGVNYPEDLDHSLSGLERPVGMKGLAEAGALLADAVSRDESILIVGDFDADGATSCALMMSALQAMGANQVQYLVPDRFKFGYGLTPQIVDVALGMNPSVLVTVDNGISSIEGVRQARENGLKVVITDHHLPGAELPNANAIVNPNQPGCEFPGKYLAGVGVAFYVLSVIRANLKKSGWFENRTEPSLATWLDLVALGTIADVVPLDQNNRRLVEEGLRRIRAGQGRPGLHALLALAGVDYRYATSRDLAFMVAPRINAAGRLEDMTIGIECLLSSGDGAQTLAERLNSLNEDRKQIESEMREQAMAIVDELDAELVGGLCIYRPEWHQGVVGIVASRVKEKSQRPVIAFAPGDPGEIKGSGRSVAGFHMRDALDLIANRHPGLLSKFGGHAMAAGLTLRLDDLPVFTAAFNVVVSEQLGEAPMEQVAVSDGEIGEPITIALAQMLEEVAPWGQAFPEPEFDDDFEVLEQRIVGGSHLRLLIQPPQGEPVEAICFNYPGLVENRRIHCAYRLEVNRFRGMKKPQIVITMIL